MNYRGLKIDGVDVKTAGVRVMNIAPYKLPVKRSEIIQIPGRSGSVEIFSGAYDDVPYEVEVFCDGDFLPFMNMLRAGREIIMSTQPNYKFLYRLEQLTSIERMLAHWHHVKIPFICDPLRREATETVLNNPTQVTNSGNMPCRPTLIVQATGNVTVQLGNQMITAQNDGGTLVIDGETMTSTLNGVPIDDTMVGIYPVVLPSETLNLSVTGGTCTVLPNWRWV